MIDKQIHRDEIKLRLLLTNNCNRNCLHCLNDFQDKNPIRYLKKEIALNAIKYYCYCFKDKVPLQVYLSGGEPTLHKDYLDILKYAKDLNCRTTLCTNGDNLEIEDLINVDCLHIGTYEKNENPIKLKGDVQCVYSTKNPYLNEDLIGYYLDHNIKVKIFADFFNEDLTSYYSFMERIEKYFNNNKLLSFRYTGIQENRGLGCKGCKKRCVTLKGIWVFPDGGITPCPQKFKKEYPDLDNPYSWEFLFYFSHGFHRRIRV